MSASRGSTAALRAVRHRLTFTGSKSGAYVLVGRAFAQISQFAIFILAARLLSPAEFGIFAVTSAMVILLARVAEAGWREFVMSSRNDQAIDQAMMAAILAGLVCATACSALSAAVGIWFGLSQMARLLMLFAIWLPIASVTAVQSGMLVRRGRLAILTVVQITAETVGLAATVAGLLTGLGVFALVYGRLAHQAVHLAGVLAATRWFPRLALDRATFRELVGFSRYILASRLIAFARAYGATLSIGFVLGPASIGFFRAAERISLALSEVLAETFQVIGWMRFRRSLEGTSEGPEAILIRRARLKCEASFLHPILLASAAPVFVGLATVSENLVETALGRDWAPAAAVLSIVAIRQLLVMPSFLTEPLLATAGEVRRVPPVAAANAILCIALVVVTAPFGIVAVAVGQLLAAIVSFSAALWLQVRYGGIAVGEIMTRSAFIVPATILLVLGALAADRFGLAAGWPAAGRLALQVVAGGTAYLGACLLLQRLVAGPVRLLARPDPAYA